MYAERVHGKKILLENPAKVSRLKTERLEKRRKEQERKKLGRKREPYDKRVWKLDEGQAKFELFLPLHHLWMGYMSELLGLGHFSGPPKSRDMPSTSGMHPKLLKADFHGSIMTVRRSKNISLIGLSGIVIYESENAFTVVTRKNQSKLVPKRNSVFTFAVPLYSTLPKGHTFELPLPVAAPGTDLDTVLDRPHIEFELYGNQFCFRSADRAGRKFKPKETIEL